MKEYKKLLTVQDISCIGQCSITVALPILSAAGVETCILPSAVLSTHTAPCFKGFTFNDLTDEMPLITNHWKNLGVKFAAIYTGYLGNFKQIEIVKDCVKNLLKEGGKAFIDPAMADNGALYTGFDGNFVEKMKELVPISDVLLPNITEACLLSGVEYRENYDEEYILTVLKKLTALGAKTVVLTGVGYEKGFTGVAVYDGKSLKYYKHKKISQSYHGTGDIYSSAFVGAYLNGKDYYQSAVVAADYAVKCIEATLSDKEHTYGTKFETVLPDYIKSL